MSEIPNATLKNPILRICAGTVPQTSQVWEPQRSSTGVGGQMTTGPGINASGVTVQVQTATYAQAATNAWTVVATFKLGVVGVGTEIIADSNADLMRLVATSCPQGCSYDLWTSETLPRSNVNVVDASGVLVNANGRAAVRQGFRISTGQMAAFRARFVTAGTTLPAAHELALAAPLERLMKSTLWPKLQVLWVPLGADGDLAAARICLIENSGTTSLINDNFVAGDYTAAGGFNAAGNTNKRLRTTFTASANGAANGMVNTDWGFSCYMTGVPAAGVCMGMVSTANAYIGFSTSFVSNYSSTQLTHQVGKGLLSLQYQNGKPSAWYGSYKHSESTAAVTALTFGSGLAGAYSIFSVNSGFYSDGICCGMAAYSGLTSAELGILRDFFHDVNYALGRPVWTIAGFPDTCVGFGDSITFGTGVTTSSNRFLSRLGSKFNLPANNQGVGGRAIISPTAPGGVFGNISNTTNGYIPTILRNMGSINIVALGLNDTYILPRVGLSLVEEAYGRIIDTAIGASGRPETWILCSPYYAPGSTGNYVDEANQQAIGKIIQAKANQYGLVFVDLLNGSLRGQDISNWDAGGIHPNDAMHGLIFNDIVAAFNAKWGTAQVSGQL